jgi:hypothetical protein
MRSRVENNSVVVDEIHDATARIGEKHRATEQHGSATAYSGINGLENTYARFDFVCGSRANVTVSPVTNDPMIHDDTTMFYMPPPNCPAAHQ